jgi:hypothetical protein
VVLLAALLALPLACALPSLAARSPKPRQAQALLALVPLQGQLKGQHHKGWRAATAAAADGAVAESCPEGATLPLLTIHPVNQSLTAHEPALAALARLPAPVCVLSAVGGARDGKSSWLNLFSDWLRAHWATTGSSGGAFSVEHGLLGAGTNKIWLQTMTGEHGEPFPGTQCRSIVLFDTPGLGSSTSAVGSVRAAHDALTLALLSSSTVVLNVMRELNDEALERLRAGFRHARAALAADAFGGSAPNLLVLLRDAPSHSLVATPSTRRPLPVEARLHAALQPVGDSLDSTRAALAGLFPNRTMALMRSPDHADLAELATSGLPAEDGTFYASFAEAAQRALAMLAPKTVGGVQLTGEVLAAAVHSLAAQINEPTERGLSLRLTVLALLEQQARAAVSAAKRAFAEAAPPFEHASGRLAVALPASSLDLLLRNATSAAYNEFLALAPMAEFADDDSWLQPYAEQVRAAVEAEAESRRQAHQHASSIAAERAINRRLRDEARDAREDLERLRALQTSSRRWREFTADAAVLFLAAGCAVLPSGFLARFGPGMKAAPAIVASLGLWRVAQRSFSRWAGSFRELLNLNWPEQAMAMGKAASDGVAHHPAQ